MAIRVTCTQCHTRFDVSEKFAGKEGPCPKCKTKIRVPSLSEEVIIHAPTPSGPRDSKGGYLLKPIRRQETELTGVQIALIVGSIIGCLAAALILRFVIGGDPSKFPFWILIGGAIAAVPPLAYVGYHLLRDQELGTFETSNLRLRVLLCIPIYAALWLAFPIAYIAFNDSYSLGSWLTAVTAMLGLGGLAGMVLFDFDYIFGLIHYGLYLLTCLTGRWLAGLGFMPSEIPSSNRPRTTTGAWLEFQPHLFDGTWIEGCGFWWTQAGMGLGWPF